VRLPTIAGAAAVAFVLSACGGTADGDSQEAPSQQQDATTAPEEQASVDSESGDPQAGDATSDGQGDREVDMPYFYGFGCEGAGVTLLDMAAFYAEFDPTAASMADAATFRAMGQALITAADLPDDGAMGEETTITDQAIYASGVSAVDLADVIEGGGFTREVEEQTAILGEDATRVVDECGLD
jgi:hypothetical protein